MQPLTQVVVFSPPFTDLNRTLSTRPFWGKSSTAFTRVTLLPA
jgi:hypothetical protein